jgi:hypothetical protein
MDPTRFDRLVRTFSTTPTRRGILTALARATAGATLAALVAVPRSEDAVAACRQLFEVCTSNRQCCRHKHKRRICALNEHSGAPDEPSCCIPEGKRCEFGGQCCDNLGCVGTAGEGRCGAITSDRAVKADFASVDGQAVLAQVAALPIQSWRYRTEETAVRHIGPMAQDFAAAFHVGDDDRHIHVVDAQGVALAAIQGLLQELHVLQAQNATLTARVAALEDRREG